MMKLNMRPEQSAVKAQFQLIHLMPFEVTTHTTGIALADLHPLKIF
jgi:hypothetical protein